MSKNLAPEIRRKNGVATLVIAFVAMCLLGWAAVWPEEIVAHFQNQVAAIWYIVAVLGVFLWALIAGIRDALA